MAESREHNEFKLTEPERSVRAELEGDVTLSCHLSPETSAVAMTIRWFKGTECIHLYKNGQVIEGRGYKGRVSLVTQELEIGIVSLRLRNYRRSDRGEYICQVIYGRQREEIAVGLWMNVSLIAQIKEELWVDPLGYLESESPDDETKREESACLLEVQLDRVRRLEILERERKEREKILEEKDKQLRERDERLKERDRECDEKDQQLKERDDELKRMQDELEKNNTELEEKDKLLKERDKLLKDRKRRLEEKDRHLEEVKKTLEEVKKTLGECEKRIEEKDLLLEERKKQLEDTESRLEGTTTQLQELETKSCDTTQEVREKERQQEELREDLEDKNHQVENLRVQLQQKDTELEERNQRLREKEEQLLVKNQRLEILESEGTDREKRLREKEEQLGERDNLLKERDRHTEDVKKDNIELAQQICDLKTEVERLRNSLSIQTTERGEISDAGPKLPIRRRDSKDSPPEMGGETTERDPIPPPRRRHSMDIGLPNMGGESSSPDPPVSPRVSELRLVLLGRTGAGRRAAGNTILGREEFGAQAGPSAVPQRSRMREGNVWGRRLVLVDTPDWFCPGLSLEEMREDVGLCVRLSAPGPHAFLLVVPVEPSEGEERGAMERMEQMFGEGCWGHTVILFTHADSLREQSMEEILQTGSQDLQQLVEKCGNRCHVLNIKDRAHDTQVPELLDQVEKMVAGNTESFYSSQTYLVAEAQVREMEGKVQREREEKILKEEAEMEEKFEKELQNSLKKIEGVIQEHEGDIRTLSHRTTELERQMKEERDKEKKRELERELMRETDRREEVERKLERSREKRENERREREERHRQEMEEMRENFEGEARVEAEKNLMKMVLPELQRTIMISQTKMQKEFNRQMKEKDRQMEEKDREMEEKDRRMEVLTQKLKDLSGMFLEEVYDVSNWSSSKT